MNRFDSFIVFRGFAHNQIRLTVLKTPARTISSKTKWFGHNYWTLALVIVLNCLLIHPQMQLFAQLLCPSKDGRDYFALKNIDFRIKIPLLASTFAKISDNSTSQSSCVSVSFQSMIAKLPYSILCELLSVWLETKEVTKTDTACCNLKERSTLL